MWQALTIMAKYDDVEVPATAFDESLWHYVEGSVYQKKWNSSRGKVFTIISEKT